MKKQRSTPIEMGSETFRKIGHQLIDSVADFLDNIPGKPVTPGETPDEVQQVLGNASLPEQGIPAEAIMARAVDLLQNHSLLNGHPKFFGYITSSPAPIGALADLLAASINPNGGANILSPMATAIEKQTVKWLAEFIGVSPEYGGLLVSGGNMANLTAFCAARTAKAPAGLKENGLAALPAEMVFYCAKSTHTWIEKAAMLFGHGTRAIRWIATYADNRINLEILSATIDQDLENGKMPFLVVGNAGDVSTGVVDNLAGISAICKKYNLWFHIDGAYGVPAVAVPELKLLFDGMQEADSIALDPHKWLYAPLEVGCTLVKNPQHLLDTYSSHPAYYNFSNYGEIPVVNFYEYGFQNSRGFRALKVWMALQQVGSKGYIEMIREDVELSKLLYEKAKEHPELEAITQNLSITTLRYLPSNINKANEDLEPYLNRLNEALLNALQKGGKLFLSNALVGEKYCLRACIVNFRTSEKDIDEMIDIIVREGKNIVNQLQVSEVVAE